MNKQLQFETTSFSLHVIAMVLMLCDHLWGTIIPGNDWLTCIGRLSFPIFAFLIVEGYFHTKSLKKYVMRLLIFALISEIPFNLMVGSRIFYPIHQNVLWTFLISIALIHMNEKAKSSNHFFKRLFTGILSVILGFVLGLVTMVDFYHAGVLTVLAFYFFRGRKWWCYLGQLISMWMIHAEMLGGLGYELSLFGQTFFLSQQSFAMFALIPIWLYQGKQGYHSKLTQYFNYFFYPAHLLILGLLKMVI
ncbi:MAG: hypothetical protein IJC38_03890 [Erysipelotrichaceae bacterium]|nr:hypothetical protein [Erysipelotrichaceae bacterium]